MKTRRFEAYSLAARQQQNKARLIRRTGTISSGHAASAAFFVQE
jgi:hypothetical protein